MLSKIVINRRLPNIKILPICFCLKKMINSKLISELVSSYKSVFLCFNAAQVRLTTSDKHNNLFCACAIAKFSE